MQMRQGAADTAAEQSGANQHQAQAPDRVQADAPPPGRTHQMWIRVYDVCPHQGVHTDHAPKTREGL